MILIALLIVMIATIAICFSTWEAYQKAQFAAISAVIASIISASCYCAGTRQDYYSEVWNYKIIKVKYYEYWDEEVQCRHPHYVTKTRMVTKTDSKGREYEEEEEYEEQEGWEHPYDVDEHPKHWTAQTEYGDEKGIDWNTYEKWKKIWGNSNFVNLHHTSVHSQDGNMYESNFTNKFDDIFPWEDIHDYENRVRVSNSIFNYGKVSKSIQKKYYRPADNGLFDAVLSYDGTPLAESENELIRKVNADLGPSSRIHIIVLLWNQPNESVMDDVLGAWKGPNKNELIISIGVRPDRSITWVQCYSWVDDTTIHAKIRQDVQAMPKLNFIMLKDSLLKEVPTYWHKKNFHDFDYIHNPLPTWDYILATILDIVGCVGAVVIVVALGQDR